MMISFLIENFWWLALVVAALAAVFFLFLRFPKQAFFCLVAYLPFQLALNLSQGIDLLSGRLLILLLFLAVWLKQPKGENIRLGLGRISLAWLGFLAVALISVLVAQNPLWAGRKFLVFASIFPLFLLAKAFFNTPLFFSKIFWVITGGAVLSSLVALGQFLAQWVFGLERTMNFWARFVVPYFLGQNFGQRVLADPSWLAAVGGRTLMRAIGLFPDPHMLSFYLGLILPLPLAFLLLGRRPKKILLAMSSLFVVTLLLTFSRGGYLGLLVSAAVLIIFTRFHQGRSVLGDRKILVYFLGAAAIVSLVAGGVVGERFFSIFDLDEGSNLGRLAVWQESWQTIRDQPLLGKGLGNYPLAVNFAEPYRSAMTSHNLYLDLWAELGIFGLLAWLAMTAVAVWPLVALARKESSEFSVPAVGLLGAWAYFSVHSFFETAIFNPTVLAFLMIILGLSSSLTKLPKNSNQLPQSGRGITRWFQNSLLPERAERVKG